MLLVIPSLEPRAGILKPSALMALFLAFVLAWVGGARTGLGNLGEATDRGLVGASAERAEAEAIPTGKPSGDESSEGNQIRSERESEDGPAFAPDSIVRATIETRGDAVGRDMQVTDATSHLRARLLLASIRARGPPVG